MSTATLATPDALADVMYDILGECPMDPLSIEFQCDGVGVMRLCATHGATLTLSAIRNIWRALGVQSATIAPTMPEDCDECEREHALAPAVSGKIRYLAALDNGALYRITEG